MQWINHISLLSSSGTRFEVTIDGFKTLKEGVEEYMAEKLDCVATKWFKFSYKSLKLLIKVAVNYVDLITDCILVGTVLAFVGVAFGDYSSFSTQIIIILLSSILAPLLTSAFLIAYQTPLG